MQRPDRHPQTPSHDARTRPVAGPDRRVDRGRPPPPVGSRPGLGRPWADPSLRPVRVAAFGNNDDDRGDHRRIPEPRGIARRLGTRDGRRVDTHDGQDEWHQLEAGRDIPLGGAVAGRFARHLDRGDESRPVLRHDLRGDGHDLRAADAGADSAPDTPPDAEADPAPDARPTPKPAAAPFAAAPTTAPTATPTAAPTETASASPSPTTSPSMSPAPSEDAVAVVPGLASAPPGGGTTQPGAPVRPPAGGGHNAPLAAFVAGLDLLTSGRPSVPLGLVATLVTTSGVVGATLAFGVFGKRRREGEQPAPDDVLHHNASSPLAIAAAAAYADEPGARFTRGRRRGERPTPARH